MTDLPTLGRSRKPPNGRLAGIVVLLVLGALFLAYRLYSHRSSAPPPSPVTTVPSPPPTAAPGNPAPPAPVATIEDGGAAVAAPASGTAPAAGAGKASPADEELKKAGVKRLRVEVTGPLETAVVKEVGPEGGPRLVQVLVRSLVWWLSVPGDLRRGDLLELLY